MVSTFLRTANLRNTTDLLSCFCHLFFLETTAHTLAFAFTLLALYQEEQEKLIDHINEIIPIDTEAVSKSFLLFRFESRTHSFSFIF